MFIDKVQGKSPIRDGVALGVSDVLLCTKFIWLTTYVLDFSKMNKNAANEIWSNFFSFKALVIALNCPNHDVSTFVLSSQNFWEFLVQLVPIEMPHIRTVQEKPLLIRKCNKTPLLGVPIMMFTSKMESTFLVTWSQKKQNFKEL